VSVINVHNGQVRPMFSIDSLAQYFGVGRNTIKRLIDRGEIPVYRVGAQVRIRPEDVDRYLARHREDHAA
jgi:putative molybdopterin biosynthesis protein